MATLRQYYELDFSNYLKMDININLGNEKIEGSILYDFISLSSFISLYFPKNNQNADYYKNIIDWFSREKIEVEFPENINIRLPSAKQISGEIRVTNRNENLVEMKFHGDKHWHSQQSMKLTNRLYFYIEDWMTDAQLENILKHSEEKKYSLQILSEKYRSEKSKFEKPLVFISHDSRDKTIAKDIAINLQKMSCPVWYDEFNLKAGSNLRQSIELGLKECRVCLLLLSKNFLSNKGWAQTEFESVFARHVNGNKNILMPVWVGVTVEEVQDYSSYLSGIAGLHYKEDEVDALCRKIIRDTGI